MRGILATIALTALAAVAAPAALATQHGPLARIGTVTYNYTGATPLTDDVRTSVGEFYINYLEGDLVNGGTRMGVRDELLEAVKRVRAETNQLNNGLGAWEPEIDERGNFFGGHYKKYEGDLPEPRFRLDATINVFERPENREHFDMNFYVNIIDTRTGEVVGHASAWKRDTPKYINEQIVGPEPTWVERYLTGYVREITYEDPLETIIADASRQTIGQLASLNRQEITSDADRFFRTIEDQQLYAKSLAESGYRPIVPEEVRNPRAIGRLGTAGRRQACAESGQVPVVSLEEARAVAGSAECPHFALSETEGIWCGGSVEELITESGGTFRHRPPAFVIGDAASEPCRKVEASPPPSVEPMPEVQPAPVDPGVIEFERWLEKVRNQPLPKSRQDLPPDPRGGAPPGAYTVPR